MGDIPLWAIVGSFVGWELYAHFVAKNKAEHTLSNRIWRLEQKLGWPGRGLVAAAVAVLFAHLVFQVP